MSMLGAIPKNENLFIYHPHLSDPEVTYPHVLMSPGYCTKSEITQLLGSRLG